MFALLTIGVAQHGVPDDYRRIRRCVNQLRGGASTEVAVVQEEISLAEDDSLEARDNDAKSQPNSVGNKGETHLMEC